MLETERVTPQVDEAQDLKFSSVLRDALASKDDEDITVGQILDRVADRGFGVVLVLLSLPTMIPVLPPGASAVVGTLFAIIGVQMLAGARRPWMPQWVRRHRLSARTLLRLRTRGMRLVQRVERISHERWAFMRSAVAIRLLGLVIIAIGVLLFLPLPFMNTAPGIAMLVVGIGIANRDGVFVFIGALLSAALIFIAIRFGHVLVWLYRRLRSL